MVKRFWGIALIIAILPFFCMTSVRGQLTNTELVYYKAMVNTVRIYYLSPYQTIYGTRGEDIITGSGVIVTGGQVLTCYHILDKFPAGKIRIVQFNENGSDKREGEQVQIVSYSEAVDLLLLKVDPPFNTECIKLASVRPEIGSEVIITGHTNLGVTRLRLYRYLEGPRGIMVTPVYAGDSGGGVFNANGELIGIIQMCMILERQATLYGYAIPLDILREFLHERAQ